MHDPILFRSELFFKLSARLFRRRKGRVRIKRRKRRIENALVTRLISELFQSCISRDKVSIFFYVPILRVCVHRLLSFGITMLITALLKI